MDLAAQLRMCDELDAAGTAEAHVDEGEVRAVFAEEGERRGLVVRQLHRVVERLEHVREALGEVPIVLDDQDPARRGPVGLRLLRIGLHSLAR